MMAGRRRRHDRVARAMAARSALGRPSAALPRSISPLALPGRRARGRSSRREPGRALRLLLSPAPSATARRIGYTLYYATNFIFTGLAVAVAFHGGLFNIGAEGQAYIGGLGVALVCLAPIAGRCCRCLRSPSSAAASSAPRWAFVPAWLQAKRGSHVVITTIMFNFIASALMIYLLVNVLSRRRASSRRRRAIRASTWLPQHARAVAGLRPGDRALAAQPLVSLLARRRWPCLALSGTRGWATSSAPSATTRRPPCMPASAGPA